MQWASAALRACDVRPVLAVPRGLGSGQSAARLPGAQRMLRGKPEPNRLGPAGLPSRTGWAGIWKPVADATNEQKMLVRYRGIC